MNTNNISMIGNDRFISMIIDIYNFFHLSAKQACVLFDVTISTWNRIKKGTFNGNFSQDQKFRILQLRNLIDNIKNLKFESNWLFSRMNSENFNKTPYDLVTESGLYGIVIANILIQGKALSELQK